MKPFNNDLEIKGMRTDEGLKESRDDRAEPCACQGFYTNPNCPVHSQRHPFFDNIAALTERMMEEMTTPKPITPEDLTVSPDWNPPEYFWEEYLKEQGLDASTLNADHEGYKAARRAFLAGMLRMAQMISCCCGALHPVSRRRMTDLKTFFKELDSALAK